MASTEVPRARLDSYTMNEHNDPDWLAELAKGGEALRRQVESIVQAAEQFVAGGSARPLARRITRAVGAAMREIQPPPVHAVAHPGVPEVSVALPAAITFSGSVALPPLSGWGPLSLRRGMPG